MLGLFATLNLGTRSLQTQRTGVEVAGQNLANVNNSAYARQRVQIQTSLAINTTLGPQGTGADSIAIKQIRDLILDGHIQSELSVGGYWDVQQRAFQYAQAGLGEYIDRQADALGGTAAAGDGMVRGLADELSNLFNAFQRVANSPESGTERDLLMHQAQTLATRFNQTGKLLGDVHNSLNESLGQSVTDANKLFTEIAKLNDQIANAEFATGGVANDLRDVRQQKLESLAKLVNIETSTNANGSVNVSVDGTMLVSDKQVLDTLQMYDLGGSQMMVRTATGGAPLTLSGGAMQGAIEARDGAVYRTHVSLNMLASQLITQVNTLHAGGFSLSGTTGANFFTGTDAATIGVNLALVNDSSLIQAGGVAGAPGDNAVIRSMAALADTRLSGLSNRTFSETWGQAVAGLGQSLNNANNQIADHQVLEGMLTRQRDSVSGVSVDEEMGDLVRFQKAYEASAKLITTVDEMLDTVISLKR